MLVSEFQGAVDCIIHNFLRVVLTANPIDFHNIFVVRSVIHNSPDTFSQFRSCHLGLKEFRRRSDSCTFAKFDSNLFFLDEFSIVSLIVDAGDADNWYLSSYSIGEASPTSMGDEAFYFW